MNKENITKRIINLCVINLFYFLVLASGFAFMFIGVFLLPQIEDQLMGLERNLLMIKIILFTIAGGIACGTLSLMYSGHKLIQEYIEETKYGEDKE